MDDLSMTEKTDNFLIRKFQASDWAGCYRVCLKTGDNGSDGSHLFTDPEILGHLYVGPYLEFEKDLSYVLVNEDEVLGYALGTVDTTLFYERYVKEWLPPLQVKYPMPVNPAPQWNETEKCIALLHDPRIFYPESFHPYPAHLHIDLLPTAQGMGIGTRLMHILMNHLKSKGALGVHLAMSETNTRAGHFYRKLGFNELCRVPGDAIYMGRSLD